MWFAASLAAVSVSFAVLLRSLRPIAEDRLTCSVILLIWGRFALVALGDLATRPVAAGHSLLALGTLAMIAFTVLIFPLGRLRLREATPFAVFLGVTVISALLNGRAGALVDTLSLWALFFVVALLLHRAMQIHGLQRILSLLLAVFALPLAVQGLSILLGQAAVGQDGTVGYIGNFAHEAVFSIVALTALCLVTLYPWSGRWSACAAFALVLASLALANYRTVMLAAGPLVLVMLAHMIPRKSASGAIAIYAVLVLALVPVLSALLQTERFANLPTAVREFDTLVKPPDEFSAVDKDVLSARVFIAALYVRDFIEGGPAAWLIGFGPGAEARDVGVHPHNEYLRILFETGVIGFAVWLGAILRLVALSLARVGGPAGTAAAGGCAALLIGSLGTSFFNRPEGLIFFALLCATTWFLCERRAPAVRHHAPDGLERSA